MLFIPSYLFAPIDHKITIRDGNFTDIEGLDPTITWENSALLSNDVALQVS